MTRRKAVPPAPKRIVARWAFRAGPDGIAHACRLPRVYARTAACGAERIDERWAWPERTRCTACLELVSGWPA